MTKIVLLEKIHRNAAALLAEHGFSNVVEIAGVSTGYELIGALKDVSAVGIRSRTHTSSKMLDALPDLRLSLAFLSVPIRSIWMLLAFVAFRYSTRRFKICDSLLDW